MNEREAERPGEDGQDGQKDQLHEVVERLLAAEEFVHDVNVPDAADHEERQDDGDVRRGAEQAVHDRDEPLGDRGKLVGQAGLFADLGDVDRDGGDEAGGGGAGQPLEVPVRFFRRRPSRR